MTQSDITHRRLSNQHITRQAGKQPGDMVQWLGAVQAQDYAAAQWALGLRLPGVTAIEIEQAFTDGVLLRTHVMRPTWHFVSPTDIRWLLALTGPRVNATNASYYRSLELDDNLFRKSNDALANALQGNQQLTRPELVSVLKLAGIATDNALRCIHIIMRAELDGIICSGARRGKQFTYALLDERVPQTPPLARDAALAELAGRYFTSHGPATLRDFVWWSGLTMADARAGLDMVTSHLLHEVIDGQAYWFSPSLPPAQDTSQIAHLLPNFDEYIVGYTDRSAIFDTSYTTKLDARGSVLFTHTMVLNGQIIGAWARTIKKDTVVLTLNPFTSLNTTEIRAFTAAANRYGAFLNLPVSQQEYDNESV